MIAWSLAIGLCLLTIVVHYEAIALITRMRRHLSKNLRWRMMQTVSVLFAAHVLEIQLFAAGFYFSAAWPELGGLTGAVSNSVTDFSYFSAASYTSVGYGDIYATGPIRVVAGMEALVGLLMIAWSGAFTVFYMERHWADGYDEGS